MKALNLTNTFADLRELNQQGRLLLQLHGHTLPFGLMLRLAVASGQLETILRLLVEADVTLTYDVQVQPTLPKGRGQLTQIFEGDSQRMTEALTLWELLKAMWGKK